MFSQIITFLSTHDALSAERVLKERGIEQTIVPTPRSLSGNCGIAIRIGGRDADRAREVLEAAGVKIDAISDSPRPGG